MRISGLSDVHKMGPHEYSLLAALPGVDPDTLRTAIHGLDRVLLKAQVVATPPMCMPRRPKTNLSKGQRS